MKYAFGIFAHQVRFHPREKVTLLYIGSSNFFFFLERKLRETLLIQVKSNYIIEKIESQSIQLTIEIVALTRV